MGSLTQSRRGEAYAALSAVFTGALLLSLGAAEIFLHAGSSLPILGALCGSGASLETVLAVFHQSHCWGCPVALIGATLLVAAAQLALRSHGDRKTLCPAVAPPA